MSKYGPQQKSVRKAFAAAVAIRTELQRKALAWIHTELDKQHVGKEERNVISRRIGTIESVNIFVDELCEMDEIVVRLVKFL